MSDEPKEIGPEEPVQVPLWEVACCPTFDIRVMERKRGALVLKDKREVHDGRDSSEP